MGCTATEPTVLHENNNSCIAQTENPLHHKRTKHIDIAYHFTRQMVDEDVVVLVKIHLNHIVFLCVSDRGARVLVEKIFQKFAKIPNLWVE